jgi:hypothetical protein
MVPFLVAQFINKGYGVGVLELQNLRVPSGFGSMIMWLAQALRFLHRSEFQYHPHLLPD